MPQNSCNCAYPAVIINSVINSRILIVIRITTEIKRFVASERIHRSRNFVRIRQQQQNKIRRIVVSCDGKNSFENSWIRIVIGITNKSNRLLLVKHPNPPQISSRFVNNVLSYSANRQTNKGKNITFLT